MSLDYLLVYGSETGQAQSIAEQIAEKSTEFGLKPRLHCLDDFGKGFDLEKEMCMVIITSTTGDGEPPENAAKFFRKIKKRTLSVDYLAHLNYALLGLGDTNYSNFCKCPKDVDKRLEELGAKRFYNSGFADDGVGLELVVDPWLEGLYPAVKQFLQKYNSNSTTTDSILTQTVSVLTLSDKTAERDFKPSHSLSMNGIENDGASNYRDQDVSNKESESQLRNVLNVNPQLDPNTSANNFESTSTNGIVDDKTICDKLTSEGNGLSQNVEHSGDIGKGILCEIAATLEGKALTIPVLSPPFLHIDYIENKFDTTSLPHQNNLKLPSSASDIIYAHVNHAKTLTHPDAVKKTLQLELRFPDGTVEYNPGDSISVICPNSDDEVLFLLQRLNVDKSADQQLTLSLIPETKKRRAAVPSHIHPTTTLRHLLKTCVGIRDVPSKAMIRMFVEYTSNEIQKERLQQLCSKEGVEEYTKYVREKNTSLLDFLYAFPSCLPPIERVIEFLPRLLPRPYSVCSCIEHNSDSVIIVFNIVEINLDLDNCHYYSRRGICTGWLDELTNRLQSSQSPNNDTVVDKNSLLKIPIYLRTNQHFRPPTDLSKPLILIGPGTGVAPFIGFLQQRMLHCKSAKDRSSNGGEFISGATWLFTGFRNKEKDYLFRRELEEFASNGTLTRLCVSFSRDVKSNHRYVQDFMTSESKSIAKMLVDQEAFVYVCGDAKNMAKDVTAALQGILVCQKGMSGDEASAYLMKKRLHKTYLEDVWT